MAATNPADGAVRRSIQGALGDKLKEVTDLVNALNVEIFLLDERCENAEAENEKLRAWLCVCPEAALAAFDPDERCPIHGDPAKARSMRAVLAELAKYTGWEPTIRDEFDHAIGQLDAARKVVEKFDGSDKLRVNQFLADLKHALEM